MMLVFEAVTKVLTEDLASAPMPVPGGVRLAHERDEVDPLYPMITLDQQGGGSWLPVAGAGDMYLVVQTWTRQGPLEPMLLYGWVASRINMRRTALTEAMAGQGVCHTIYRVFESKPLYDETANLYYVTARYYVKAFDYSDLHMAFG